MTIHIFNTLSRKKEEFRPLNDGKVTMYSCGPTVYDFFHIGNARTFVMSDVIRRYLEYSGYNVKFVMNITDVDDRIIDKSIKEQVDASMVADRYATAFIEDIESLGVRIPDVTPRATEHISEMIRIIKKLVDLGYAYELDGSVYFEAEKFEGYGKLSGKKIADLLSGARVEIDEKKKNPVNFALWKKSKTGEPAWESPWGPGRPGWHIECSAMSMKHLGEEIDIHTGGNDLVFPHHENEIAQSEASTGHPFVRYWIHLGFLNIDDEKMSKSLGNFFTAREVLERYRPEVIRMFFLQKHYRSPLNFSDSILDDAAAAHRRLETTIDRVRELLGDKALEGKGDLPAGKLLHIKEAVEKAMNDDFNTAGAMGKLFDLVTLMNSAADRATDEDRELLLMAYGIFSGFNGFLGIYGLTEQKEGQTESAALIDLLVEIRRELRAKKEFEIGDRIRQELEKLGVTLKDTPAGTEWRIN